MLFRSEATRSIVARRSASTPESSAQIASVSIRCSSGTDPTPSGEAPWARSLRALASRHDVTGVIVRDAREADLPEVGVVTFVDLETSEEIEVDTSQAGVREAYSAHARRRRDAVERAFARAGALAWEVTTSESVVGSIVRLLETRKRMATGLRRAQVAG